MADEPNFIDLFALTKITPQAVVEKFGTSINSSFFDASNILGGLKIKGLIDFTTVFGGQNSITITDLGHKLLDEAASKANLPLDHLDIAILVQLSGGKRSLNDLTNTLNILPKDLSMHLYKLMQQGFLSAEFRNGVLNLMLSEKGFMQAKAGLPPAQPAAQPGAQQGLQQPGAPSQPSPTPQPAYSQPQQSAQQGPIQPPPASANTAQQQTQGNVDEMARQLQQPKKGRKGMPIAIAIIIVVIAVLLLYLFKLI